MTPARRRVLPLVLLGLALAGCSEARPRPGPPLPDAAAPALGDTVDAADAFVIDLAVTPGDPDRRAVLWQRGERDVVLAITDDGFATRRLLPVPGESAVEALDDGRYALREGDLDAGGPVRFRVVGADPAADADVVLTATPVPLAPGEALLTRGHPGRLEAIGVAADGRAHPVPVPRGLHTVRAHGGRIDGIGRSAGRPTAYHWSDDGGAAWSRQVLGRRSDPLLVEPVPTAAGQPPVVVEGADGATLLPFVAVWRLGAGAGAWTRTPVVPAPGRHLTTSGSWLGADGALRAFATSASVGEDRERSGLWRVGDDGRLAPVGTDRPGVTGAPGASPLLVEFAPDGRGVTAVWTGAKPGTAWRSTDDGVHWARFALR